jgi:hypothetical protein
LAAKSAKGTEEFFATSVGLSRGQTKSLKLVGRRCCAAFGFQFAIHAGVATATPYHIVYESDNSGFIAGLRRPGGSRLNQK